MIDYRCTGGLIFVDMVLRILYLPAYIIFKPAKWFVYREETEGPDVQ